MNERGNSRCSELSRSVFLPSALPQSESRTASQLKFGRHFGSHTILPLDATEIYRVEMARKTFQASLEVSQPEASCSRILECDLMTKLRLRGSGAATEVRSGRNKERQNEAFAIGLSREVTQA